MSDDDLTRTLSEALDAQARSAVPDTAAAPPPRFAALPAPAPVRRSRRRARVLAPLAAAAAVAAIGASVLALQDGSPAKRTVGAAASSSTSTSPSTTASGVSSAAHPVSPPTPKRGSGAPVRIEFGTAGGAQYGVGMPVVAYFSRQFTDASALSAATSVTVGGKPAHAAWFFEQSTTRRGFPVEGHLRLRDYWPAHAHVDVALATDGVSAGTGLVFSTSPRLDFSTGARTVGVVNASDHLLTVSRDGAALGSFRVSLGADRSPTKRGVKVIMSKASSVCMHDVGGTYYECGIKSAQRLTDSGEYLLGAPWNHADIAAGIDSSNGCVNLQPADATHLYSVLEVGDVVEFPNANGPAMTLGDGLGDWNVPWQTWLTGGLIPTHAR